jgi:hypothetical protein
VIEKHNYIVGMIVYNLLSLMYNQNTKELTLKTYNYKEN